MSEGSSLKNVTEGRGVKDFLALFKLIRKCVKRTCWQTVEVVQMGERAKKR